MGLNSHGFEVLPEPPTKFCLEDFSGTFLSCVVKYFQTTPADQFQRPMDHIPKTLKEWYKLKNLGGCFGATYKKGKDSPQPAYTALVTKEVTCGFGKSDNLSLSLSQGLVFKDISHHNRLGSSLRSQATWSPCSLMDFTCSFK